MSTKARQVTIAAAAMGFAVMGANVPARAASVTAEEFVATAQPIIEFVEAAGRLALDTSNHKRIRDFARSQIRSQAAADDAIVSWRREEIRLESAAAASPTIDGLAPVTKVVTVPFSAVVAFDRTVGYPFAPLVSANDEQIAARNELSGLAARRGADFDSLYVSSQNDALLRLSTAYKDFILNGDDGTLRRIAVDNLPGVQRRIADLHHAGS